MKQNKILLWRYKTPLTDKGIKLLPFQTRKNRKRKYEVKEEPLKCFVNLTNTKIII